MKKAVISDYDGTIADTFAPSPNGIGVEEAYEIAVRRIFGKLGVSLYQSIEGLKNQAPGELVVALLDAAGDDFLALVTEARDFHRRNNEDMLKLIPEGKGSGLTWSEENPEITISEMLVLQKLRVYETEMGPDWPKPFDGFLSFLNECDNRSVTFAILSSGHEFFIKKTFELWDTKCPVMLTDDDLRGKSPYLSKPNSVLMERLLDLIPNCEPSIYLGDDLEKDGGLATNSGVRFGWFNPSGKPTHGRFPKGAWEFQSWYHLGDMVFV